ncbi:hypothetical protein AAG570_004385 [Ranatra chinensis]|uniref:DNA 5'-3' helicase n=1 Tax=Ranatra chinensis TaxID=642074 RepID=A0ABD0Y1J5_9HEMI
MVRRRRLQTLCPDKAVFVSVTQIKNCLTSSSLLYEEGYTCLQLECPVCKPGELSMYINKISGFFICKNCKSSGDWNTMEQALVKQDQKSLSQCTAMNIKNSTTAKEWAAVMAKYPTPSKVPSAKLNAILEACELQHIPVRLLTQLEARIDVKMSGILLPLKFGSSDVGYKRIGPKTENDIDEAEVSGCGILITAGQSRSSTTIVVCCPRDFLALAACQKLHHEVICLPHGQQSLPQELLPLFEPYKKLVLWFANDLASWNCVRMFAKKLNEKRCFLVRPQEKQPSPQIALQEGYDLADIVEKAQPISHASITTFAELREDVLSEIFNVDKVSGVKWKRFPQLNSMLKGHRRGELTVLTGPTGSGKTTFISEYSLDLAIQGVTTLWGSFEIRNQRLARTMLQQYVMTPLEDNLSMFNFWADSFQRLPLYFMTFHGQQSIEFVMEAVEHASYVHDIGHVIIDNVQFMLGMSVTETGFLDRFYRQDALIAAFRNFATLHNVHVTLVIHPRKEREGEQLTTNSIFGGAKASQEADNVLIIQQRTLQSLKIRKFLQIAKNRFSGDLGIMPLDFDKASLSFSKKENKSV